MHVSLVRSSITDDVISVSPLTDRLDMGHLRLALRHAPLVPEIIGGTRECASRHLHLWSFFKSNAIIPSLKYVNSISFLSARIFLQRRFDDSFESAG